MEKNEEERLIRVGTSADETYFILSQIKDNTITLTVTDGISAWMGIISESNSKNASTKLSVSFDDYLDDIRKALSGDENFHYEFHKQESKMKVSLKKHLQADNIKIQFAVAIVKQHSSPSTVICDMFMSAITNAENQEQQTSHLVQEKQRLEKESQKSKELIEKFANVKEDTENDLYSKFVLVLNEKKAKIRELEDQLNEDHGTDVRPSINKATESTSVERSGTVDVDTSDEEMRRPAPKKKKKLI